MSDVNADSDVPVVEYEVYGGFADPADILCFQGLCAIDGGVGGGHCPHLARGVWSAVVGDQVSCDVLSVSGPLIG